MDEHLRALVAAGPDGRAVVEFTEPAAGRVRVLPSAAGAAAGQAYTLKPLPELYGPGTGQGSVDLQDSAFLLLLGSIEESLIDANKADPRLTDGAVSMALDRLCMSPEGDVGHDRVAAAVQAGLRLTLSLSDYSRQDVRHCLRKVKQSVKRHTSLGLARICGGSGTMAGNPVMEASCRDRSRLRTRPRRWWPRGRSRRTAPCGRRCGRPRTGRGWPPSRPS